MIQIKNDKLKHIITAVLKILNRFAPYIELFIIYYFIKDYVSTSDNQWAVLLYAIPIVLLFRLIKWEYKAFMTREIIKDTAINKRVQGFCGYQGCGKTSLMLATGYILNSPSIYTNFPCKIRNKYTKKLSDAVLNMDTRIEENSCIMISEATMFYHNLLDNVSDKDIVNKLYPQELHQQIVRHAYNGNMFYDSIDLNRMPKMLKDNIGLTNYLLGQKSKTFSFIITPLLASIGKMLGIELRGNMRIWEVQQFESIPVQQYVFDLSRQEKDTNTKNYANLLELCCWEDVTHFEYDDRFLRGLYNKLPQNIDKKWSSLIFSDTELKEIGYGFLIDFFDAKLSKQQINVSNIDINNKI